MMFGLFGHNHGGQQQCSGDHGPGGHSHGGPVGGGDGHSHGGLEDLTQEQREQLMQMVRARMEMMKQHHGEIPSHMLQNGPVFQHPEAEELRNASGLVRGYGHEPPPLPQGWGDLGPAPPPPPAQMGQHGMMPGGVINMEEGKSFIVPSRDNYWQISLPWIGRLRLVKDRKGFMQASAIFLYWLYGNWSTWNVILIPRYIEGSISTATVLCKFSRRLIYFNLATRSLK